MKARRKKSELSCGCEYRAYFSALVSNFLFHLLLLTCCLPPSLANGGTSSEKLRPNDPPTLSSDETRQGPNTTGAPSLRATTATVLPDEQTSNLSSIDSDTVKSSPGSFNFASKLNGPTESALWESRISTPKNQTDETGKTELERIIELVRSIRFEPKKKTQKPHARLKTTPKIEPNDAPPLAEQPNEPPQGQISSQGKPKNARILPYQPISDRTLKMIENGLKHPRQIRNPLRLAEVLFVSGYLKEAAVSYNEALKRKDPNDASLAEDRAWILFQTANSLRKENPSAAIETYGKLIAEYPNSSWAPLAKAQIELIDWLQKDKPRTLISESRS
jgi:hypothetical protein